MKSLGSFVLALFAVAVVGGEEKKEAKFDPAKLVGEWTIVSGTKAGVASPKEALAGKVTFTKDTITIQAAPDQKFVMTYKIVSKTSPADIDIVMKEAPVPDAKDSKAEGIIAVTDDEVKLCYVDATAKDRAKRPEKFESTKENKAHCFVLKRAK
jgi:uncharacterized protein (TIGR03067 family)